MIKKRVIAIFCLLGVSLGAYSQESKSVELATFAGGCFWCMEPPFEKLDGVNSVISGYAGGEELNPTYKQVSSGLTGHAEVVQISFDPNKVSYQKLLEVFWRQIDPTTPNQQFVDKGPQYRSAIFYHNKKQQKLAAQSREALGKLNKYGKGAKIVTELLPLKKFYVAEDYHQDYYKINPLRYKFYRYNSGRDKFLDKIWGQGNH